METVSQSYQYGLVIHPQAQYSNVGQTDVPGEVVVWSVQLGLLGLPQGTTTVAELGSPSEQGLNAGWRVWLCEPGSMEEDEGKESTCK